MEEGDAAATVLMRYHDYYHGREHGGRVRHVQKLLTDAIALTDACRETTSVVQGSSGTLLFCGAQSRGQKDSSGVSESLKCWEKHVMLGHEVAARRNAEKAGLRRWFSQDALPKWK